MIKTSDKYKQKILNAKTNNGVIMSTNINKFTDEKSYENVTKMNVIKMNEKKKVIFKRKPRVHISTKTGFNELKEKLSIVRHLNKSQFTFPEINMTNIFEWKNDIEEIANFCRKEDVTIPVYIKGIVQNFARLSTYKSDTLEELEVEYIDSKNVSIKYDEQRIRNKSVEKIMDNFRYTFIRAHNLASANEFPYGVRLDLNENMLQQYDRSNLTEFEIVNFMSHIKNSNSLNITDDGIATIENDLQTDTLGKSHLEAALKEIKESFPESCPPIVDKFLNRIKNDPASSKYSITDILENDDIDNLLLTYNSAAVLIGNHDVISKELESLNNKNNVWQNINFKYQKIKQVKGVSFVKEAKRVLKLYDGDEVLEYFSDLIDKAPEYCLVPFISENIFKKSDFKSYNQDRYLKYEAMCQLMEGKDGGVDYMEEYYIEPNSLSKSEIPKFRYKFINDFYLQDILDVWKLYVKKIKRLKTVLTNLNKNKKTRTPEIQEIALSKIDRLTNSKFSYPAYVNLINLFHSDGKTIQHDIKNVSKAVELFLERFFGDDVFEVDFKKNNYIIRDTEFLKLIKHTQEGGYPQDHKGRANYFVSDKLEKFTKDYEDYEDYQGTNEDRCDKSIEDIMDITGLMEFGWWEDTASGDTVYCGYKYNPKNAKIEKINISFEHIQNHIQTHGSIRATETNSRDGAKTKAFNTTSKYFEYIKTQQSSPKVKVKYTVTQLAMKELQLDTIIEYYKGQEK